MSKKLQTLCVLCLALVTVASANLLVHYTFDETSGAVATDASGNGYDGTINGTTTWVAGYVDGALEFTGDSNVEIPAASMELYSDVGSVAFWMKADVPTSIYTMFWGGDNTTGTGFGPENEMHVHLESAVTDIWAGGELSFFAIAEPSVHLFSDPAKGTNPATPPASPILMGDLEWHHVAAVWSDGDSKMRLYIDGEIVTEADYVSTGYPLNVMFLGQMGSGNRKFIGSLDDVRIYSNALTDQEVLDIAVNPSVVNSSQTNPRDFTLHQNYPNPFNPTTTISYHVEKNSDVMLAIYNQNGQKICTLVQESQGFGFHSVHWDGRDDVGQQQSSGVYLYRLRVNDQVQTRKLMLIK